LKLISAAMIAVFATACAHCTTGEIRSALVPELKSKTVALMKRDRDGDMAAYCTGVWVSPTVVLTAAHCVDGEIAINYVTSNHSPELYEEPTVLYSGVILARDTDHDLALVESMNLAPHGIARLADRDPDVGADLTLVGSTVGLAFTVSPGTVAAYKLSLKYLATSVEGPFIEMISGAWGGNSGGPVFDMRGRLVGVMILKSPAPSVGFAVHRVTVLNFLKANGV
jgi:S1-C subfamily serine protease